MTNLFTDYMGLALKNPLVASPSPLSEHLGNIRLMEDAGISAVVLHSIFQEQITGASNPDEYLEEIRRAKSAVSIPVIAGLNAHSSGDWARYAKSTEDAGADAIELNINVVSASLDTTGTDIEDAYVEIVRSVKDGVRIPVAVKMNPYFSSIAHMAKRIDDAGANALVLFDRFYQPDMDLENGLVIPSVALSQPAEIRLSLQWIAILYGRIKADMAATTGVHDAQAVLKVVMAGGKVAMLCSTLLKNGVRYASTILEEMETWMEQHKIESVRQMRGKMSYQHTKNPAEVERANYRQMIGSGFVNLRRPAK